MDKQKKENAKKMKIREEINKKIFQYIVAGFGLVAGLAWNDAIKSFIEHFFPLEQNSLLAKFVYALAMTILIVIVSVYLSRIFKKEEEEK